MEEMKKMLSRMLSNEEVKVVKVDWADSYYGYHVRMYDENMNIVDCAYVYVDPDVEYADLDVFDEIDKLLEQTNFEYVDDSRPCTYVRRAPSKP